MICGFELVTRGFEIVTREFELVTRGFELVTRRLELVICGFGLIIRGFELITRGFELVTLGFELVTCGVKLAPFQLMFLSLQPVTRNLKLLACYSYFTISLNFKCQLRFLTSVVVSSHVSSTTFSTEYYFLI